MASRTTANSKRRRAGRNRAIWSLASLASFLSSGVTGQFCEPLYDNTWEGLREAIDFSFDFAILCPFHISGDGCPKDTDGYQVQYQDLYIMCESFFGRGDGLTCVIDCPGTHFTVFPQASLTLDGVTLQGSTNSAVRIKPTATFTSYSSTYKNNTNLSGNGGAIDAEPESKVTLMYSTFEKNKALNGGALYHRGRALVKGSTFIDNVATNGGGGAIFSGSQSETGLVQDLFQGNQASFFGPAVFDGSGAASTREANTACGNVLGNTIGGYYAVCDGVYLASGGTGVCTPFEFECVAPTVPPTTSLAPSVAPSSNHPSMEPSQEPSVMPSSMPSGVATENPTLAPTMPPTSSPTQGPTFSSTPLSTENPTTSPTTAPTLPGEPTQFPTASPTLEPTPFSSLQPTKSPTTTGSSQSTTGQPTPSPSPSNNSSSQSAMGETSSNPTSSKNPTEAPTPPLSTEPPAPFELPSTTRPTLPVSNNDPTSLPSQQLSVTYSPTTSPSDSPTQTKTSEPSSPPTTAPSASPTTKPSLRPSSLPTEAPSLLQTVAPSLRGTPSPSSNETTNTTGLGKRGRHLFK